MKADRLATKARNFQHPKSYVTKDGRDILHGEDWINRKRELWRRCKTRCEYIYESGRRCVAMGQIPAHIIPRKDITQRDDRMSNLMCYCVEHDRETEGQNWRRTRFGERAIA